VAGYGLASTANSAGNIVSEFIVNADRFAIMRGGSNTTAASVPFIVQTSTTNLNGVTVPAGVYMQDGFIKNGSIVNAKIGNAAIDNAKIANIDAGKINAGTISTSRLNIDGSTLTSSNGVLQVNALNANKITSGSIIASVMSGTTVFANKLTGDVNTIIPFRTTTSTPFRGPSGEVTLNTVSLSASTHPQGHKVFAVASGYLDASNTKVYYVKMYIRSSPSSSYVLVGESRVKSNTGSFVPFTVTGVLNTPTTSTATMKLTIRRYGSNGVTPDGNTDYDYVRERQGAVMGVR